MFTLNSKVAIITGGGSGIGKAISELFAQQGANVYILDVNEAGAQQTVAEIREKNGNAWFKKCDIGDKAETNRVISEIIAEKGGIDIVVNNAGIPHIGNVEQATDADMERLIQVNIKGVYHVIQSCIPYLKERGGVILNMASIASIVGLADRFIYSMTKGAVNGMTLSVARDYLSYNIRCNSISPARVHTPFVDGFLAKNYPGKEKEMFSKLEASQPIGRMAKPVEIAGLALYLCSNEAAFITGCDYPIDGGFVKLNT